MIPSKLEKNIDAAIGRIPCDLILKNVLYLDVFQLEWVKGEIAIHDGIIVGIAPLHEPENFLKGKKIIDCKFKKCVPGFIDAHVHIESSLVTPKNFEAMVLPLGTTTAICDPHELTNVVGVKGLHYFLRESEKLTLDLKVMLSSCVPATFAAMETNGGGVVSANDLNKLKNHKNVLGLAEMMNVPGVLFKDKDVLDKIKIFSDSSFRMDGHAPLLKGKSLSAYATTGISSCHESSQRSEASEKLRNGIRVWIREGSVAKDLEELAPLLTLKTVEHIGFCTDDRNPLDIAHEGHLNYLIAKAIQLGVEEKCAYKSASYSVARHYGLTEGQERRGAIAPGFKADLVLLKDSKKGTIESVLKNGIIIQKNSFKYKKSSNPFPKTMNVNPYKEKDLEGVAGKVHVIGVIPGKIITERFIKNHNDKGVARISVIERHKSKKDPSKLKPMNAYVSGFGKNFKGAIASSVGHDCHNIICVGENTHDMKVAIDSLIKSGGGFSVVQNGKVLAKLELPVAGILSTESPLIIKNKLLKLRKMSKKIGCELDEPFLQLAFLSLPVIPTLKITDKGLVDVDQFKIISVKA